jgi:ATP adenylyltransferase
MVDEMSKHHGCVFCSLPQDRVIDENEYFLIVEDIYPVSKNHCLVISKRHVANYFELSREEKASLVDALELAKIHVDRQDPAITGYNIGINVGRDAGQTVMHFHQHLIPRRSNDMEDPAGGVRGVIPGKQKY